VATQSSGEDVRKGEITFHRGTKKDGKGNSGVSCANRAQKLRLPGRGRAAGAGDSLIQFIPKNGSGDNLSQQLEREETLETAPVGWSRIKTPIESTLRRREGE